MNKEQRIKICKDILNAYSISQKLTDIDEAIVLNEFKNHPDWEKKKGVGIDFIYVDKDTFNNRCFYIKRIDSSFEDISYIKSIRNLNKLHNIHRAGRNTIDFIIKDYRKNNVIYGESKCAISNEILTQDNTHIDHYDLKFADMVKLFISKHGEDYLLNNIDHSGTGVYFKCNILKNNFIDFHNSNCKLRAVTQYINSRI